MGNYTKKYLLRPACNRKNLIYVANKNLSYNSHATVKISVTTGMQPGKKSVATLVQPENLGSCNREKNSVASGMQPKKS
jgi:hypothetical protein